VYIETPFFLISNVVDDVERVLSQKRGTPLVEFIENVNGDLIFVKFDVVSVVVSSDIAPPIVKLDSNIATFDRSLEAFVFIEVKFDQTSAFEVWSEETFDCKE
jgi:hypothetical protein